MYYFYILYSVQKDRYYTGYTGHFQGRLYRHQINHKGFTGKNNDWKIVHAEAFETKSEAFARERQVKKWKNRKGIESLIQRNSAVD